MHYTHLISVDELKALQARDEELDGLFERIYEDNVSGKLSDDRFARMSRRYEEEQKELAEKISELQRMADTLQRWHDCCDGGEQADCPILNGLAAES